MKVGSKKIKLKKLIATGIIISLLFILFSVVKNGIQDKYTQEMYDFRQQKDDHFKTSENSPIEDQVNFKNLTYFNPSEKFRVLTKIFQLKDSLIISMINNDGGKAEYLRYAQLVFILDEVKDTLILYRKKSLSSAVNAYFLPFYDATNGDETYEGGRYLDIELNKKDTLTFMLDFNLAYNPYCLYNYRFSCPVPPKENKLTSRIEAGEKMFSK